MFFVQFIHFTEGVFSFYQIIFLVKWQSLKNKEHFKLKLDLNLRTQLKIILDSSDFDELIQHI